MSRRNKLILGGGIAGVLVLGAVGIILAVASQHAADRQSVENAIAKAEASYKDGHYQEAQNGSSLAQGLLDRHRGLFSQQDAQKHQRSIAQVYHRSETLLAVAEQLHPDTELASGAKAVQGILQKEVVGKDPELKAMIHARLDKRILACAKTLCSTKRDAEKQMKVISAFVETYKPHLTAEAADQLDAMAQEALAAVVERFQKDTRSAFDDIAGVLSQGNVNGAILRIDQVAGRLRDAPPILAKGLCKDYDAVVEALRAGRPLPPKTAFQLSKTVQSKLRSLFAVKCFVDARCNGGAHLAVMRQLGDLVAQATKLAAGHPGLTQYAQRQLGAETQEGRSSLRFLLQKAAQIRQPDEAKRKEAWLAAMTLRAAAVNPKLGFSPEDFRCTTTSLQTELSHAGDRILLKISAADWQKRIVTEALGYRFETPWSESLYRIFLWTARLAKGMKQSGLEQGRAAPWRILEGPGVPVAMAAVNGKATCVFDGEVCAAEATAQEGQEAVAAFRTAAKALQASIEDDERLSKNLRMALEHILNGTYGQLEKEDYVDGDFCRRVLQGPYLEKYVPNLSAEQKESLARFRKTLAVVQNGREIFHFQRKDGTRIAALRNLSADLGQVSLEGGDQDANHVASSSTCNWRIQPPNDSTRFAEPLPSRQIYPLFLVMTFKGTHRTPPRDAKPIRVEVVHATEGTLSAYTLGAERMEGDATRWNKVLGADIGPFRRPWLGGPGWGFPIHVPIFDGQHRPQAIVTVNGILENEDFEAIKDPAERRAAQDKWLARCAATLKTPGELALFFRYLARYCLDSPIPTQPGLIGRKKATGEFHQTVYQLLDRKVTGHFIGDCDDLAEFYQVVTRLQGKNSLVFGLPSHAACGYVDVTKRPDGQGNLYSLIFLQTGPAMIFTGTDLHKTVESGVRSFDRDGSFSFNPDAIQFLLRFGHDETRNRFSLSDTVLVDPAYADKMIKLQSYWYYHYYATAIPVTKELVSTHPTAGNYNELFGLYQAVGLYDKALEVYQESAKAGSRDDLSRLMDVLKAAYLYSQNEEPEKGLACINEIEKTMQGYMQARDGRALARSASLRMQTAGYLASEKQFLRAQALLRVDVDYCQRVQGRLSDPLMRTFRGIYASIRHEEEEGKTLEPGIARLRDSLQKDLKQAFAHGYFQATDDFNRILGRYMLLGAFAVAQAGTEASIEKLTADGPYPEGDREHHKRGADITDEDWSWMRICPPLYWGLATNFLDPEEKDKYNPEKALKLLKAMRKGYAKAIEAKLGSMGLMDRNMLTASLRRALLEKDLPAFERLFAQVHEKDYSEYYGSAADEFGRSSGFIPLAELPAWIEVFHKCFSRKQYYFRAAYAAIRNKHYEHGLAIANAAASFFPDDAAMAKEARCMPGLVKRLKQRDTEIEARKNKHEKK